MAALSEDLRQKILAYIPRYPSKQAVTLPALHIVHDAMRCVSNDAIREIADMLDLSPAQVHDTMTFYQFFREENAPLGNTRLWVCRSLACGLRGGDELLEHFCEKLHVQPGGTTKDGKITLEFAECLGACELAPAILVNDQREGRIRPDLIEKIVNWVQQSRGMELASADLLQAIRRKGRTIVFAVEGSDERRNLQVCEANALYLGGEGYNHIILREDARKLEALEEFLHGSQQKAKVLQRLEHPWDVEIHVGRFMVRHARLLGLSPEDVDVVRETLRRYEDAREVPHAD